MLDTRLFGYFCVRERILVAHTSLRLLAGAAALVLAARCVEVVSQRQVQTLIVSDIVDIDRIISAVHKRLLSVVLRVSSSQAECIVLQPAFLDCCVEVVLMRFEIEILHVSF